MSQAGDFYLCIYVLCVSGARAGSSLALGLCSSLSAGWYSLGPWRGFYLVLAAKVRWNEKPGPFLTYTCDSSLGYMLAHIARGYISSHTSKYGDNQVIDHGTSRNSLLW